MTIKLVKPQIVYLVERAPPPPTSQAPAWLERVKYIVGVALVIIGLTLLFGATLALSGHCVGWLAISPELVHPFFLTAVTCSLGGFHLVKGHSNSSVEITAGPLAVTL
jgi:hypothetical protein